MCFCTVSDEIGKPLSVKIRANHDELTPPDSVTGAVSRLSRISLIRASMRARTSSLELMRIRWTAHNVPAVEAFDGLSRSAASRFSCVCFVGFGLRGTFYSLFGWAGFAAWRRSDVVDEIIPQIVQIETDFADVILCFAGVEFDFLDQRHRGTVLGCVFLPKFGLFLTGLGCVNARHRRPDGPTGRDDSDNDRYHRLHLSPLEFCWGSSGHGLPRLDERLRIVSHFGSQLQMYPR